MENNIETLNNRTIYRTENPVVSTISLRTIGNIPVTGNYEVNAPYPLDARTLVPTEDCLYSGDWWCTEFQVDTILYNGMVVTCAENNTVYVYRGETRNIVPGDIIDLHDWKKQMLDDSQIDWPLNMLNEILHIGYELDNPYTGSQGLLLTTKEDQEVGVNSGTYGSIYLNKNFISIGVNNLDTTDASFPFIPTEVLTKNEITFEEYNNKQTGIFIPIKNLDSQGIDPDKNKNLFQPPLSIYSAKEDGILLKTALNKETGRVQIKGGEINSSTDGNFIVYAQKDVSIYANENLKLNSSTFNINSSSNATINSSINVNINTNNLNIDASNYTLNSSIITLTSKGKLSLLGDVSLYGYYGSEFGIYHKDAPNHNSNINMSAAININASTNVNINAVNSNIVANAHKGTILQNANKLKADIETDTHIKSNNVSIYTNDFLLRKSTTDNYFLIEGNSDTTSILNLEAKAESKIAKLELSALNTENKKTYIGLLSTDISIYSYGEQGDGTVKINSNNLITLKSTNNINLQSKAINLDASVFINGMLFPEGDANKSGGVLTITYNGSINPPYSLSWNKDIGAKNDSINGADNKFIKIAECPKDAGSAGALMAGDKETLIISIADNENVEIFSILIEIKADGDYVNIHRLSHFKDKTSHNILVTKRTGANNFDLWVEINDPTNTKSVSWLSLASTSRWNVFDSASKKVSAITDGNADDITIVRTNEVILIDKGTGNAYEKELFIPNPIYSNNSIGVNENGFLRYTNTGNNTGALSWGKLDNQLKDVANNDAGTKIYIVGTEKPGLTMSTCNEFYNSPKVYIDLFLNIFATAFYATSDRNKKDNILNIIYNDASILIPKEYILKESGKKAYGFIAQEVEDAGYNSIVNTDENGSKTLDYNSAFAIAIALLQEKIKQLETEIKILKNK